MKQLILLVIFLLSAMSAHADVFKCKTDNGTVYSETPCAGNAMVVTGSPNPSPEAAQAARDQMTRDNQYSTQSAREHVAREAQFNQRRVISSVTFGVHRTTTSVVPGYRLRAEREEEEEEHERHQQNNAGNQSNTPQASAPQPGGSSSGPATFSHAPATHAAGIGAMHR